MADGTIPHERREFYVYVIFRPNGVPCYVGKGTKSRWNEHERRAYNPHLRRIIKNAGGKVPKVKVREDLTDEEARLTEIALIAAIGRQINGGPLVNLTDGGDGVAGLSHSPETRKKISQNRKGIKNGPMTDSHRKALSDAKKLKSLSAEQIEKLQAAKRLMSPERRREAARKTAEKNRGRPLSETHKKRLSEIMVGRIIGPETREKLRQANLGKKHTEATKAKQSAAKKGKKRGPYSEAHCAAIANALIGKVRGPLSKEALESRRRTVAKNRLEKLQLGTDLFTFFSISPSG